MRWCAANAVLLSATFAGCAALHRSDLQVACTLVHAVRETRGITLCEDTWTCPRPPGGRFDRIGLHRLAACEGANGPVVLYLPGMHMNGELLQSDARYDLRIYLATEGVRTWGLDYRTHAVPAETAPDGLQALAGWNAQLFAEDATWAARLIQRGDPGPLYLAGFSYGASVAYRLAARDDVPLAGLIMLDGVAGSTRSDGQGPAIDVGGRRLPYDARASLLRAVRLNANGPSPLPGYATAGDALAETLYSAQSFGGKGGLTDPHRVSDVRVLADLLDGYDRWWPRAALGGDPPAPRAALPVIAFASTNFGPEWAAKVRASAEAFGGQAVELHELPGYGHLDVLVGNQASRLVYLPIKRWLTQRSLPH